MGLADHVIERVRTHAVCEGAQQDFKYYLPEMKGVYLDGGNCDNEKEHKVFDASAIEFWTMSRLYWDPQQDVERLRKYFIRRAFREAAPEIERIYGTIREEWFKSPRASTIGENPLDLAKARTLGDAIVRIQKPDGRIQTLWTTACGKDLQSDWVNCMAASVKALVNLSRFDNK